MIFLSKTEIERLPRTIENVIMYGDDLFKDGDTSHLHLIDVESEMTYLKSLPEGQLERELAESVRWGKFARLKRFKRWGGSLWE